MDAFEPGDRVVAIDTDISRMIHPPQRKKGPEFHYPDGVLRKDVVYHVATVKWVPAGQGLFITGLRGFWRDREIAWGAVRFRKLDSLRGYVPIKESLKQPCVEKLPAMTHAGGIREEITQGASL